MPKGDEMSLLGVTGERSREFMIAAAREREPTREREERTGRPDAHLSLSCGSLRSRGPGVCFCVCSWGGALDVVSVSPVTMRPPSALCAADRRRDRAGDAGRNVLSCAQEMRSHQNTVSLSLPNYSPSSSSLS